ncbi:pseudouridine synthase [Mycoplasma sp. CSL7475-4]|uniref:pseudouridine synthase n=1 Tax=Mycoplasma sp. CSL7475-4 TaxID=2973942 RepID=UPI00216B0A1C|nr:pseudouridine synthase [Mycoplasma sp. CSL7475-4]MCS4536841.1 pseudouridine synthase [Mycoplasma sp. CSL7475-4]
MPKERIEKIIARSTQFSRAQITKMIRKGDIAVNGTKILKSIQVDIENDAISIKNQPITLTKYHYYLFNKPAGYLSANNDKNQQTIFDLIDLKKNQYFCVGRLDKDTEGLLIITDDGSWSNWVLKPQNHVPKTYHVEVDKDFDDHIKNYTGDIKIQNHVVKDYKFNFIAKNICQLTIYEGKFHQVKQMLSFFGYQVTYLKRISFGSINLPLDLKKGELRQIDESIINSLKKI